MLFSLRSALQSAAMGIGGVFHGVGGTGGVIHGDMPKDKIKLTKDKAYELFILIANIYILDTKGKEKRKKDGKIP